MKKTKAKGKGKAEMAWQMVAAKVSLRTQIIQLKDELADVNGQLSLSALEVRTLKEDLQRVRTRAKRYELLIDYLLGHH